jgi:hypothetical protein
MISNWVGVRLLELSDDMSDGVSHRAHIDTETFKALLALNGGGAVALLTSLSWVLSSKIYFILAPSIVKGIVILAMGLGCAIIHNRFRRLCSHVYSLNKLRPPAGSILGWRLKQPTVCAFSIAYMWLSLAAFGLAGLVVAANALRVMSSTT